MPSFSAVLLAGGKSTRMGRDKALLPIPHSNLLLWQRQLLVLEELRPDEIFWSGSKRPGLPASLRMVEDEISDAGPLGGISACLNRLKSDLLLVLAIDLPEMTSAFLKGLLAQSLDAKGTVMRHTTGVFEPLAAVYPKGLSALAERNLRSGRHALQDLLREAVEQKSMQPVEIRGTDLTLFRNWNEPDPQTATFATVDGKC